MSEVGEARFRFPPLERRGLLLGLQAGPLLTIAAGLLGGLVALGLLPGALGPAGALGVVASSVVAACWPVAGDPPVRWAPVVLGWVTRRNAMPLLDATPLVGQPLVGRRIDDVGPTPGRARRPSPPPATAPAGIRLRTLPALPGEAEIGVVEDRLSGRWSAVVPMSGPALGLLAPADQARQVARWGVVLASVGRDGSALKRLQWVQRCAPADPSPLLEGARLAAGPAAARHAYADLVRTESSAVLEHRTLLVVTVGGGRALPGRRPSSGLDELLRREVRLVRGQLRQCEMAAGAPLDRARLAAELAAAADPIAPVGAGADVSPWPAAVDEQWSAVRVDRGWQATFWVSEWPRLPVGPDVLGPLLALGGARTVSVTMAPVEPERAMREVQSARTAGMADDALRRQAGFVTSARRSREADSTARREFELADGHSDYRFSGYLGVAGRTPEELDARCGDLEHAARRSGLAIRRLYGRQAEARTWTLPIGRGLS